MSDPNTVKSTTRGRISKDHPQEIMKIARFVEWLKATREGDTARANDFQQGLRQSGIEVRVITNALVPQPSVVQERLAKCLEETEVLRQLLRLSIKREEIRQKQEERKRKADELYGRLNGASSE